MSADDVRRAAQVITSRAAGRHLVLFSDFDGTLAEFDPNPDAVRLPLHRRALLESIASRDDATVAIVSGRRLHDIRARVALRAPAYYAGLHGLEIEGDGELFEHPGAAKAADLVGQLAPDLSGALAALQGVFVENKGLSFVVHFRRATTSDGARAVEIVLHRIGPHLQRGAIRLMHGACMLELLPNIDWDKGSAVDWIGRHVAAQHQKIWPLYIGDDITDEDGFRAVRGWGLTISAAARASGADFSLDGPLEVESLLRTLVLAENQLRSGVR